MTADPTHRRLLRFILELIREVKTGEQALRCLGRIEQEIAHVLSSRTSAYQGETGEPATEAVSDDDEFRRLNFIIDCLQQIHQMLRRFRDLLDVARVSEHRFAAGPIECKDVRIDI